MSEAKAATKSNMPARRRAIAGFLDGVGAASLFIAGALPAPKPVHTSVASDWQAVGNDLRQATVMYGKKRHA